MATFKTYLKKEVLESIRRYKYLILFLGLIVWGIINTVLLRLLPTLLEGELPPELLQAMQMDRSTAVLSFFQDLFSVGNLLVVFLFMGVVAAERKQKSLMLPFTKNISATGLVLAKAVHYTVVVTIAIVFSVLINILYVFILFEEGSIELVNIVSSTGLYALYFAVTVSLLIFLGSIFKTSIIPGVITLAINFLTPMFHRVPALERILPYNLIEKSYQGFNGAVIWDADIWVTISCALLLIILLNYLAIRRLKVTEVA
ncbi:hypothetical protein PRVXH_001926 [Proteinivorax hydrogeniformans]|uniref:ABC-2 type transport system permease protein n=1 Tax=Proteinivorax hydrogeniformans TaxID=1826727 RepID=A0AAU8HR64_9FIRM